MSKGNNTGCTSPNRLWLCSIREKRKKSPGGVYCSSGCGCYSYPPVLQQRGGFLLLAGKVHEEKSIQWCGVLLFLWLPILWLPQVSPFLARTHLASTNSKIILVEFFLYMSAQVNQYLHSANLYSL